MRRIVILIALASAGFGVYRYYSTTYAPVKAYETFAEEILHQRYDAAAKLCDGLTAADLEKLGSQERIGAGPPMFQTLFPSRFAVQSRETSSDGDLTINAVQTVLFNPAGVESAIRPAMYATLKQSVKLRKVDGAWKVTAFDNVFEKMDSTSVR
jgi:hypothetical protein